jgi:hypothetical protein
MIDTLDKLQRAALLVGAIFSLALPLASRAAPSGPATAMSAHPCAGEPGGLPGPAFMHMILSPGAHFALPAQTARQKGRAARAMNLQRARDWADLCRYRAANAALKHGARVVFMGDSITDFWQDAQPSFFTRNYSPDSAYS